MLDVELWGRFEAFEQGYIAAVQHVRRVTLAPFCMLWLYTGAHELREARALIEGAWHGAELAPARDQHLDGCRHAVTSERFAEGFGVDVVWADEDGTTTQFAGSIVASFHQPRVRELRGIEDRLPGETAFVFANVVAAADGGCLWLDPLPRLGQPLAGTDVPIRCRPRRDHRDRPREPGRQDPPPAG
ncbi:MAG: hypothetical protein ACQEUI_12790 [Actinomycetota bacterium]